MRWLLVGVFVCVCGLAFLFSPSISLVRSVSRACPHLFVREHIAEGDELRDSTPLFLPTRWNVYGNDYEPGEKIGSDENWGFNGNSFLDEDENRKELDLRERFVRPEEDFFEGARRWELADSFGVRRAFGVSAPIEAGVRMSVVDCGSGKGLFRGSVALEGMYDAKMLWAPIEIDCYGEATYRHFTVIRSSGSAEIDRRVLAFVRTWASANLREQGKFRFCVGR